MRNLLFLGLVGCWGGTTHDSNWNPANAVEGDGGVYAPLEEGRIIAHVTPSGFTAVDLGEDAIVRNLYSAGGRTLAMVEAWGCELGDEPGTVEECDERVSNEGAFKRFTWLAELNPNGVSKWHEVDAAFTDFRFSDDGDVAFGLYLAGEGSAGIVNLQSAEVLFLDQGNSLSVQVGFEPEGVYYVGEGEQMRALVTSRSELAVIDIGAGATNPSARYPLTLAGDAPVLPDSLQLTPDGSHALLSISNEPDLYVIDLVDPSINIVALPGYARDVYVDSESDRTFVAHGMSVLSVIDHTSWTNVPVVLDHPVDVLVPVGDYLWGYRENARIGSSLISTVDAVPETIYLEGYPVDVAVDPAGEFLVAATMGDSSPLLEVVSLIDDTQATYAMTYEPTGLGIRGEGADKNILVLSSTDQTLFELSWPGLQIAEIQLEAPPVFLGTVDESYWIALNTPSGGMAFYTPGQPIQSVYGFSTIGLFDRR